MTAPASIPSISGMLRPDPTKVWFDGVWIDMNGRAAKDIRKHSAQVAKATVEAVSPAIQAALQNEAKTRARVDDLEQWAAGLTHMTRRERFRWLLLGR